MHNRLRTIYDIGANKGAWSSSHIKTFPGVDFHMFEASPQLNDPRNGAAWHKVALGKEDGRILDFYSTPYFNGAGNSFYKEKSSLFESTCAVTSMTQETLDSYVTNRAIELPDAIKIDTQGSELDILHGGTKCLKSAYIVQLELPILDYNSGAPKLPECIDLMRQRSFLPIGVEEIHIMQSIFVQLDVVFVKENILGSLFEPVNPIGWSLSL